MRVLIALDTSELGESAVGVIGAWSRSLPMEVHLLSVVHGDETQATEQLTSREFVQPEAAGPGDMLAVGGSLFVEPTVGGTRRIEDRSQALARVRSEREEYVRAVAARDLPDGMATVHVEVSDETAQTIVKVAEALGADAIAMATHGRTGLRHVVMGSVAEAVTRQSPIPVIVIGPQAHSTST